MQDNTTPDLLQYTLMLMCLEEQVSIQAMSQESVNSSVWLKCKQFKFHSAIFLNSSRENFNVLYWLMADHFLKSNEYLHKFLKVMKQASVLKNPHKKRAWRGKVKYSPSNKSSLEIMFSSQSESFSGQKFIYTFVSALLANSLSKVLHEKKVY